MPSPFPRPADIAKLTAKTATTKLINTITSPDHRVKASRAETMSIARSRNLTDSL
jgi:hypothetical protein